jgi:hypothetical protein
MIRYFQERLPSGLFVPTKKNGRSRAGPLGEVGEALHSAYRLWSSLSERPLYGLLRVYRHRAIRSGAPRGATLTPVEISARILQVTRRPGPGCL